MNGGRIFRQTAAGYSDDLRPDIQMNGAIVHHSIFNVIELIIIIGCYIFLYV